MQEKNTLNSLVGEVMTSGPTTIYPHETIKDAVSRFKGLGIDGLPVVDEKNNVLGILTKSHVLYALEKGAAWCDTVEKIFHRDIICIDGLTNVYDICMMPVKRLPVVDDAHKLVGMITKTDLIKIFSRDVRLIKERLFTIIESAQNGILAIDQHKNIITFNPAAEKILGLKAKDVLGKDVDTFLPGTFLSVLSTGEPESGLNIIARGKSLLLNMAPIIKNEELLGAVAFFQDISELEKITSQLASFKKLSFKLRAIIESSFDGICVVNPDGEIEEVNNAYKMLLGPEIEENKELILDKLIEEVKSTGKAVTQVQKTPAGRQVLITGNPVFNSANDISMIVTNVRDITLLNNLKNELMEAKELKDRYSRELKDLKNQKFGHNQIVANSPVMKNVVDLAQRVATFDSTILLLGETGVGKELVAQLLHTHSPRNKGPFIKVNCAAIPEHLLESELFGYAPGAFTGASKQGKPGQFELAQNGVIFLDEIADLPILLQAKLLRVLQEQEIHKVGGTAPIKINARVITATNKNLEEMVKEGLFRQDLYYRLNVVPLQIPPLRRRVEDIPSLAFILLQKYNKQFNTEKKLSPKVLDCFLQYHWPGNVRELENIIERLVVTSKDTLITAHELPDFLSGNIKGRRDEPAAASPGGFKGGYFEEDSIMPLKDAVLRLEKRIIEKTIHQHGSIRKAAKVLEVDPSTIVRKIDRYKKTP